MDSTQRSASPLRYFARFGLGSLMWLCVLVAVLLMWHQDHARLQLQVASLSGHNRIAWSIDQVLGRPNTQSYGDIPTAWASQMPDSGMEWLIVEFPYTVNAAGVDIYETYNPGAVVRVSAVSLSGTEQVLWEGNDPVVIKPSGASSKSLPVISNFDGYTSLTAPLGGFRGGVAKIRFPAPASTRRVKIYLDSASSAGWNEIDAVALIDQQAKPQWASNAWASSSFGSNRKPPTWFYP